MKNPRIKVLAREAALKIKALTVAHQFQIKAVYREFREQASNVQGDNADELHTHSATPVQSTEIDTNENNYA